MCFFFICFILDNFSCRSFLPVKNRYFLSHLVSFTHVYVFDLEASASVLKRFFGSERRLCTDDIKITYVTSLNQLGAIGSIPKSDLQPNNNLNNLNSMNRKQNFFHRFINSFRSVLFFSFSSSLLVFKIYSDKNVYGIVNLSLVTCQLLTLFTTFNGCFMFIESLINKCPFVHQQSINWNIFSLSMWIFARERKTNVLDP